MYHSRCSETQDQRACWGYAPSFQSHRTASDNRFVRLAEHRRSSTHRSISFPWEPLGVLLHLCDQLPDGLLTWVQVALALAHAHALASAIALALALTLASVRSLDHRDLRSNPRVSTMGCVRVELGPHFFQGPHFRLRPWAQGASATRHPERSQLTLLLFERHGRPHDARDERRERA